PQGAQAAKDLFDDPLPPGATARLGTVRWRQITPANFLAFSPDGKTAFSAGANKQIYVWDHDTGKELRKLGMQKVDEPSNREMAERQLLLALNAVNRQRHLGMALSSNGKQMA